MFLLVVAVVSEEQRNDIYSITVGVQKGGQQPSFVYVEWQESNK